MRVRDPYEPGGLRVWDDYGRRLKGRWHAGPPQVRAKSSTEFILEENLKLRYYLIADRRDEERYRWAITGGSDAAQFEAVFGHPWYLQWIQDGTKDFELPDDEDKDNVYEVWVTVTDVLTGAMDAQKLHVTVLDVVDSPLPELPEGFAYIIDSTGAYVKWHDAFCIAEVQV